MSRLWLHIKILPATSSKVYEMLPGQEILLGRSQDCDLVLAESDVADHHLKLRWTGAELTIEDLGTTSGTYRMPMAAPFQRTAIVGGASPINLRIGKVALVEFFAQTNSPQDLTKGEGTQVLSSESAAVAEQGTALVRKEGLKEAPRQEKKAFSSASAAVPKLPRKTLEYLSAHPHEIATRKWAACLFLVGPGLAIAVWLLREFGVLSDPGTHSFLSQTDTLLIRQGAWKDGGLHWFLARLGPELEIAGWGLAWTLLWFSICKGRLARALTASPSTVVGAHKFWRAIGFLGVVPLKLSVVVAALLWVGFPWYGPLIRQADQNPVAAYQAWKRFSEDFFTPTSKLADTQLVEPVRRAWMDQLKATANIHRGSYLYFRSYLLVQRAQVVDECGGRGGQAAWETKKLCMVLLALSGVEAFQESRPIWMRSVAQKQVALLIFDALTRIVAVEGTRSETINFLLGLFEAVGLSQDKGQVSAVLTNMNLSEMLRLQALVDMRKSVETSIHIHFMRYQVPAEYQIKTLSPLEMGV